MNLRNLPILLFTILIFVGCQKDYAPEGVVITPPIGGGTTPPSGGGTTTPNNVGCKDCVYFPTCDGSVFVNADSTFDNGTLEQAEEITTRLTYLRDTSIMGVKYRKMDVSDQGISYFGCQNGVSSQVFIDPGFDGGLAKLTILKANEMVGNSWRDTISSLGQKIIFISTMKNKNVTRTLFGKTYTDVIFYTQQVFFESPGAPPEDGGNFEFYLAKNVGLIELVGKDGNEITAHRVLKSATIP